MLIASFPTGPWQTNCYLIAAGSGAEAIAIDPGPGAAPVLAGLLEEHRLRLGAVIATHGHLDHVLDAAGLAERHRVPLFIHPDDRHLLTDPLAGLGRELAPLLPQIPGAETMAEPPEVVDLTGDSVSVAGFDLDLSHAPGHTAGSVLLRTHHPETTDGILFSGDVLFASSVGRTDLPGSDPAAMTRTLVGQVLPLPDDLVVLPGHGPQTSIGAERRTNPFLIGATR